MIGTQSASATQPTSERHSVDVRSVTDVPTLREIARVWHHYFGAVYEHDRLPRPLAKIAGWLDDDDPPLDAIAVVATHGDVSVGWGVAVFDSREETIDELPDGRFDPEALVTGPSGWLCLGAVDPAWRGQGIGRRLFERRLAWLADHDPAVVVGMSWDRDGPTSRPLFDGHGFHPIQSFDGFYGTDQSGRTVCPDCGATPHNDRECGCDATLWAIDGGDLA